ncbi:hypothetical protein IAU60_002811 [Kwoniella sp. DSM 27419]
MFTGQMDPKSPEQSTHGGLGSARMRERSTSSSNTHRPLRPRAGSSATRRSASTTDSPAVTMSEFDDVGESASDEGDETLSGDFVGNKQRKKRDEPTSPVVVVLYVVAVYLVFQILTRSDEHEILSHLPLIPSSSSFKQSHSPHSSLDLQQYHLPYGFPPIPNPLPSTPKEEGLTFWRIVVGVITYPLYLVITLLVTPLPLLMNILHIVKQILAVLISPIIAVLETCFRTFIMVPLGLARSVIEAFYPLYVFIGTVVGVGCALGAGAGLAGRTVLDWTLRWTGSSTRKEKTGKSRKRSARRSEGTRGDEYAAIHRHTLDTLDQAASDLRSRPTNVDRVRNVRPASYTNDHVDDQSYYNRSFRRRSSSAEYEEVTTPLRSVTHDPISLFASEDGAAIRRQISPIEFVEEVLGRG